MSVVIDEIDSTVEPDDTRGQPASDREGRSPARHKTLDEVASVCTASPGGSCD